VGRTASREGESSRAPVVVHVQATGLALHCSSKMASNRCTAAYATSFSRTATLEIPRGDLTSAVVQIWRAGVLKHLHSSALSFPTQVASAPCTRPLPAARTMHRLLTPSDPPTDLVEAPCRVNLRAQQEKTAALKIVHASVSCSRRLPLEAWRRKGVEKHRTAWPCNEAHRTAPGYFEGA